MVDRVNLPKDKQLAEIVVQADAERHKRDMGEIGRLFGSRDNAALYFALLIVLCALLVASLIAYNDPALRKDVLLAVLGLATTAAGFMFGLGVRKD